MSHTARQSDGRLRPRWLTFANQSEAAVLAPARAIGLEAPHSQPSGRADLALPPVQRQPQPLGRSPSRLLRFARKTSRHGCMRGRPAPKRLSHCSALGSRCIRKSAATAKRRVAVQKASAVRSPMPHPVDQDRAENHHAQDDLLRVALDVRQVHAVLDDRDHQCADECAKDLALTAGE